LHHPIAKVSIFSAAFIVLVVVLLLLFLRLLRLYSSLFVTFISSVAGFARNGVPEMGNRFSLCFKTRQTDHEETNQLGNMAKDAVYQTTPFEGQKPGTSGIATGTCIT
jgi:ABC-type iron transport system FetAB permease component